MALQDNGKYILRDMIQQDFCTHAGDWQERYEGQNLHLKFIEFVYLKDQMTMEDLNNVQEDEMHCILKETWEEISCNFEHFDDADFKREVIALYKWSVSQTMAHMGPSLPNMFGGLIGKVVKAMVPFYAQECAAQLGLPSFLTEIRKKFDEVIGDCKFWLDTTFSWIKTAWNKFMDWATQVVKAATGWAYYVLDGICICIALLSCSIFLHGIEKFLLVTNFMSEEVGFAKVFLTTMGTLLCGATLLKIGSKHTEPQSLLNKLTFEIIGKFPKWQWKNFFPDEKSAGTIVVGEITMSQANFYPVDLLMCIATTVKGFSSSAVVETGRFFNALEQIKRGLSTAKDIGQSLLLFFSDLVCSLLGRKSRFLNDASALVGHKVSFWIERCDAYIRDSVTGRMPSDVVAQGYKLLSIGREITEKISLHEVKLSHVYVDQIKRLNVRLSQVVAGLDRAGDGRQRKRPFVVAFVGKSRSGKSELRQLVERRLLERLGFSAGDIYARSRTDEYWTGYHHQQIVSFDDLGAIKTGESTDETQFIDLVSSAPYPLSMAALEEKGTFFTSPIITYSSNFTMCSPGNGVRCPEAFNNRRNIVYHVERNGVEYDPSAVWRCQRVAKLNPQTGNMVGTVERTADLELIDVIVDDIMTNFEEHDRNETSVLQSVGSFKPRLAAEIGNLASLCTYSAKFVGPDVAKCLPEGSTLIGAFDGKIWAINEAQEVVEVTKCFTSRQILAEAKMDCASIGSMMAIAVPSIKMVSESSQLYFLEMVEEKIVNDDLTLRKDAIIDPSLLEVLEEEPLWFKVVVGTVHENVFSNNEKGMFRSCYDYCIEKMSSVYSQDVSSWPLSLKVVIGAVVVALFGAGFMTFISSIGRFMCNPSESARAASTFCSSEPFGKKHRGSAEDAKFQYRNYPVRQRGSYGNAGEKRMVDIADSLEVFKKLAVEIKFGREGRMLVQLPGRRLLGLAHYFSPSFLNGRSMLCTLIYGKGETVGHVFDPTGIRRIPGSELVIYENPMLPCGRKNLERHLCSSPLEEIGKTFPVRVLGFNCLLPQEQADKCFTVPSVVNVVTRNHSIRDGDYHNIIGTHLEYKAENHNGDCGSLLFGKKGDQVVLVGVHVSGDRAQFSVACLLPQEEIEVSAPNFSSEEYFDGLEEPVVVGSCLVATHTLNKGVHIGSGGKTAYEKTPDEWHLNHPIEKEPAVLHKGDERVFNSTNPDFCPYTEGIKKYAECAGELDDPVLEQACDQMIENQCSLIDINDKFEMLSLDEAVNGFAEIDYCESMVMETSEGFPHVLSRKNGEKGKYRFFDGGPGTYVLKEGTTVFDAYADLMSVVETRVPELVCIEKPKDEKVALRKIYKTPKTRLFSVLPLEFNLLARQLFLMYMAFLMRHKGSLPCKVGVNPYGPDWDCIARALLKVNDQMLCCDYKLFDGLLSKQLMRQIIRLINAVCGGSDRLKNMRANMLWAVVSRKSIAKFVVYQVEGGLPSGFAMTVIINSLLNELLVRYYYLKIMKPYPGLTFAFDKMISLAVYGDDNLISVHPTITHLFCGKVLKEQMELNNIVITDGTDKTLTTLNFHSIEDVDFLQRKFVMNDRGRWIGPVNFISLWSQLHFVKTKNMSVSDAYLQSVENVLRELMLHPAPWYEMTRREILTIPWIKNDMLVSTLQYKEFFESQWYGDGAMKHGVIDLDVVLNPGLVHAFTNAGATFDQTMLVPRVFVADYKTFVAKESDYVVYLGCGKDSPSSSRIFWNVGDGRGMLPSPLWIRRNWWRKSEMTKKIYNHYKEDKNIVFVSSDRCVPSLVLCVIWLRVWNLLDSTSANHIVAEAFKVVKSLGYFSPEFMDFIA
uniref:RNA1 polyprotein n=1 Tax=Litsea rubescens seco-like virus TaxID=3115814 RepID=A0AAT9JIN1_9SECO